jgi:diguanylate cyclase (GGDEF)-like protein
MWTSINSTGEWEGEIWNRRKSGEVYPEYMCITAVKDSAGILTNYVATFTDITKRKELEEAVLQLAFYDTLTKLPNRRLLNDRLRQARSANKRSKVYGALMFLDLDNFKPLNDTHGHAVGDLLLIETARRLESCIREMDTVARFGGDEFVVMLSELDQDQLTSKTQAENVAEKIRESISEPFLLKVTNDDLSEATVEHHCTVSIGLTLFNGLEVNQEEVLKQADAAMYQTKAAGRNQIRFYGGES